MLAPKSLSSPQNAAITAGGTPYSFSARAKAAAYVLMWACPCCIRNGAAMRPANSVNTCPNTRWPRSRLTMPWSYTSPGEASAIACGGRPAAVAVDDPLVLPPPRRGLRDRLLRDAGGNRLLLQLGEEAIERKAVVAG